MRTLRYWLRVESFALAAFCLVAGCSREEAPAPVAIQTPPPSPAQFAEMLPHAEGVEGYVGSQACQKCHKDEYSSWHRTYHRTMTQVASPESIQADFNNVVLTNDNTRFTLTKKGDEYWARMEHIGAGASDAGGLDVRLSLVTGSHHMQVFWVPEGHGNLQLGFPFTWLIPEKRWVPRNSTFIRPPDAPHQPEAWNIVCSRCHTTGVEPHFNAAARSVETHVGELGISCEACHGPGARHVALREAAVAAASEHRLEPKEIVHPEKLSAERSAQICGFCHSMKWIDAGENWRDSGFRYRPGDNLEETTPIIRASTAASIPGLIEYLQKNPSLMGDFFWPDGMVRVSGREFNGLLDSPCAKDGNFSCISCHSGHKSEPDDMLSRVGRENSACLQCHESFRDSQQLTAHTRHAANSSGSECYNCHMPHTTYGVLKAIRSHQVSSPRVADDIETGRPNACNLCHLDKSLAWTADYLKDWFKQEKPALPEHATNISHAVRLAIAGDAGQRVLMAWHLGWDSALQASGTNWTAPVLGQLLDDPYDAVRLVAERSMKATAQFVPADYDYTIAPETRAPMRDAIWEHWLRDRRSSQPANEKMVLADKMTPEELRAAYDALLAWRDQRGVRLRE